MEGRAEVALQTHAAGTNVIRDDVAMSNEVAVSTRARVLSPRWWVRRTMMALLWFAYVILLLQLAGWIYYAVGAGRNLESYGYPVGLFSPHPQLDYVYTPGFTGQFNGAQYQDITIRINETGFRDDPFAPVPGPRTRVVVLGDSVVFGAGVAETARFTERLEASPPAGMALEVLNLGVNSYTLSHYVSQAELEIMGLHPDLVLVGFTLNDNDPRSRAWPAHQYREAEAAPDEPGMVEHVRQWAGRLAGARMLREARDRLQFALMNADEREAYHTKWMRRVVETWQNPAILNRVREELSRFDALMQAQGTPYAMVLLPERNDVANAGSFDVPRQAASRLMTSLGMPVCDPFPMFAQAGDAATLFLPGDSVHFSPAGHGLLRDGIAACMADGRIPPPRARP